MTVSLADPTQAPALPNLPSRPITVPALTVSDRTRILALLVRARRRAAAAVPHSPDWEAAAAGVDSFEQDLDALDGHAPAGNAGSRSGGATTTLDFGPANLPDAVTIQGAIVGHADAAQAVRRKMRELADQAATRQGFMRELGRLATRNGFVVEEGVADLTSVTFYAWENLPPTK